MITPCNLVEILGNFVSVEQMKFYSKLPTSASGEISLKKLSPETWCLDGNSESTESFKIAVLDCETTGLNAVQDKIVELAFLILEYNPGRGCFLKKVEDFESFQDPEEPLSDIVKKITGLKDEDLKGKRIDWREVEKLLSDCKYILAHNSEFDRNFVKKYSKFLSEKQWVCSLDLLDWEGYGFSSKKLEFLCLQHGFYYDAHRALNDVYATANLINLWEENSGKTYVQILLENSEQKYYVVKAFSAPFELKDLLKGRGYRWDPGIKVWNKKIAETDLETEKAWLQCHIYKQTMRAQIELA